MNIFMKKALVTLSISTSFLLGSASVVMAETTTHDHRTTKVPRSATNDHRTKKLPQSTTHDHRTTVDKYKKKPRDRLVKVTRTPPRDASKAQPPTLYNAEWVVPASVLTSVITSQLKDIKIHLNNYGEKRKNTWYRGGNSYVKLPKSLGGSQYTFDLPAINKFPFRYYVNDINLSSLKIGTYKNRFVAKFNLEENGIEVKGRCAGNGPKGVICKVRGSDKAAPDVHMKKMIASVYLTPAVRNGSLTFSHVSTDFTADIRIGKTCNVLKALRVGDICKSIEKEIKNGVKKAMQKSLDNNNIRNAIANALRKELAKHGVKKILSAKVEGGMVILRYLTNG